MRLNPIPRGRMAYVAAALVVAVAVGCAPAGQPSPTAAPAKPAPTTAPAKAAEQKPADKAAAKTETKPAAKKEQQTVKVTVPSLAEVTYAALQMGIDKGFFAEEGLKPEVTQAPGATGVKATAAGEFDITLTVGSATQAILRDAPLKITYLYLERPLWWVYSRENVTSWKDLEGKRLGVASPNDASHVITKELMQKQGADPSSVTAVPLGAPPQRLPALKAGSVDAAILIFPQNLEAEKEGFNKLAFFGDQFKVYMTGITVSDDTLKNKPQMLEAFMRASNKTLEHFRQNKDDAVAAMVQNFKADKDAMAQSYGEIVPLFTQNGLSDQETLRESLKAYGAELEGVDPANFPLDRIFNFTLAEKVAKGS